MSNFQIRNRWTDAVQYECELGAEFDLSPNSIRLGAAIKIAVSNKVNLSDANLRDANLRDAKHFSASWVPKIPNIHQAVLAAATCREGALDMGNWHNTCGTSHCRAGWVATLAGEGGRVLEGVVGTPNAAAMIYLASDPKLDKVPDFYCGNEAALEDMKRLAAIEAGQLSKL